MEPRDEAVTSFGARRVRPASGERVEFLVNERPVTGYAGEPLAAAMLAAGATVFRTMPDTDEARGGFCLMGRCSDFSVIVDGRANVRAAVEPVRAGMRVLTQHGLGDNAWPAVTTGS